MPLPILSSYISLLTSSFQPKNTELTVSVAVEHDFRKKFVHHSLTIQQKWEQYSENEKADSTGFK